MKNINSTIMGKNFYCNNCEFIFSAEGQKKEYQHPIYGPCSKYVAYCPQCHKECSEKIEPKKGKPKQEIPFCSSGYCGL